MTKDELFQDRRFFFDTRQMKETAEYALKYSPYEAEKVLGTADAAVSQSYIFTLRWDLEQTQVPVVFEGDIDWLRQPGDDAEFVYAFNRMRHWICFGEAYAMTGDEKYARAFAKELLSWTENVRKSDPSCQKAWRTIEAGFRMEYWSKAIQFFRSSENLTDDVVDAFVLSMKEHAEFIRGLLDQTEKELIITTNKYAEEYEGIIIILDRKSIKEGENLHFTIKANDKYNVNNMQVFVKRGEFGTPEKIESDKNGEYKYTVSNIKTNIYITVKGIEEENPTGIEPFIEDTKVYSRNKSIFVYTPKQKEVMIISINGSIVKNEMQVGLKQYIGLQRGIYIICIGKEKKVKVKI